MDRSLIISHLLHPTPESTAAASAFLANQPNAANQCSSILSSLTPSSTLTDQDLLVVWFALTAFESLASRKHFTSLPQQSQHQTHLLLWSLLPCAHTLFPSFLTQKLFQVLAKTSTALYLAGTWNLFDALETVEMGAIRLGLVKAVLEVGGGVGSSGEWRRVVLECCAVLGLEGRAGGDERVLPSLGTSPSRSGSGGVGVGVSTATSPTSIGPVTVQNDVSARDVSVLAIQILGLVVGSPLGVCAGEVDLLGMVVQVLRVHMGQCYIREVALEACGGLGEVCARTRVDVTFVRGFLEGVGSGLIDGLRRCCEGGDVDEQIAWEWGLSAGRFPTAIVQIYVSAKYMGDFSGIYPYVHGYRDGLVALCQQIVRVLLWSEEAKYLRLLSFDEPDAVSSSDQHYESEWDTFSGACLAVISKISDLYPVNIIQHVVSLFIVHATRVRQGGTSSATAYRDLTTLSQLVGQLAHFFVELGNFEENLKNTCGLIEQIVDLLGSLLEQQRSSVGQKKVDFARNQLCCALFSCLRIYIHWIDKFYSLSTLKPAEYSNQFSHLLNNILSLTVQPLLQSSPTPSKQNSSLLLHASQMLLSVASTVRPNLCGFPAMAPLLSNAHQITRTIRDRDVKFHIYKVITLAIVVPTPNPKVSEEEWSTRLAQLTEFYAPLITQFQAFWNEQGALTVDPRLAAPRGEVKHLIEAFVGCMEAVSGESVNPKNAVYMVVKRIVGRVLSLFEVYAEDSEMLLDLFDFTLALQVSLRRQSARENGTLVIETLQLFMKMVESKGLLQLAATSPVNGTAVALPTNGHSPTSQHSNLELLDKFLLFLTEIVQDTSKSIEGLLDHVVVFCQYSYKFLAHEDASNESLKLHFYNLLFVLLTFHQRHFFGSAVSRSASLHEREVAAMLEMVANSFSDRNMEVFRHNLTGLETLNSKCALYQKEFFQKHMMTPFIDLFLGILVAKGHDFMKEEIAGVLAKIMTCNSLLFTQEYVPHFMAKYCSGIHSQDQARLFDCINSVQNTTNVTEVIYSLISDLIYFQQ
ncbi:Exportin-6 [Rhizoclosmatium sp. JEL0117]|nr:Exportin-6 [Rhizoclosmatium sp. JEL0117]